MTEIEDCLANLMDDRDFHRIDQQLSRFNLFEAVGAVRGELRHSNFLSFLLSPARAHGLGSTFLLQFIRTAVGKQDRTRRAVRGIELIVADLDSAVIYRERENIDLLIEVNQLKLVVVVENKIGASIGGGQLEKYREIVKARYPGFRYLFILLTPEGLQPDDDEYIPLSYAEVGDLVDAAKEHDEVGTDVALILRHYVQMLRRHIVPDNQLASLARQLYERHKEAFDFVIEHRPQPDNLLDEIKSYLESTSELLADRPAPLILRFAPAEWNGVLQFNSCPESQWTHTGRNLIFEVRANKETDRISISLVSGPAGADIRSAIYEFARARPELFVGLVKPMGAKWATIFGKDLLSARVAEKMDGDEKRQALRDAWESFLSTEFPALKLELKNLVK